MALSADESAVALTIAADLRGKTAHRDVEAKVKDWTLAIGLRQYTPGMGCIPYMGSHVLGKTGVVHCDILMKRPCTEVWCGRCERLPGQKPCPDCVPCKYRKCYIPRQSKMTTEEELQKARDRVHHDERASHVVTYTAREDGVVCCVDMLFQFNSFYQVRVTEQDAARVEAFFQHQLWQKYNCTGLWLNYIAQLRFCCPYGTYWIDVDAQGEKMTQRKWFCSEIVSTALAIAKADGFTPQTDGRRWEPCATTPSQIAELVAKYPLCYTELSERDIMLALQQPNEDSDEDEEEDEEDEFRF